MDQAAISNLSMTTRDTIRARTMLHEYQVEGKTTTEREKSQPAYGVAGNTHITGHVNYYKGGSLEGATI